MRSVRRFARVASIPVAGLVALGCGSSTIASPPRTTAPSATTPPATVRATPTTGPPPSTTSVPSTTAAATTTACTTGQLSVTTGGSQGAAGTLLLPLIFTNTGSSICTLQGYPGVSAVVADGVQLGDPALRTPSSPTPLVALEPGQTTHAMFTYTDPTIICPDPTIALGLRVYPPDQTAALFVPTTGVAQCAGATTTNFRIYPVGGSFGN